MLVNNRFFVKYPTFGGFIRIWGDVLRSGKYKDDILAALKNLLYHIFWLFLVVKTKKLQKTLFKRTIICYNNR